MVKVEVRNIKRLQRKLDRLSGAEAKKSLRKGTREASKVIQRTAKSLAPRRTGRLRGAIRVRALRRSRKKRVGSQVLVGEGFFRGATFYGAFQEFGWKTRQGRTQGTRRTIPGKHFMEQAAKRKKDAALRRFLVETNKMIRSIARSR